MKTIKTGITLNIETYKRLNEFMKTIGVSNRSGIIDKALNHYITERLSLMGEGKGVGIITVIYDHHAGNIEHKLTHVQHDYLDIVITNLHIHLDKDKCLEIVVVRGEIKRIRSMVNTLEKLRGIKIIRHDIHTIEQ